MKTQITKEQIAAYRDKGFLVIKGFLNASELAAWQKNFDEAIADRLIYAKDFMTNQREPSHFFARVFIQCNRLADTHKGMRNLLINEEFGKIAVELAGTLGIRIWHDQALIKPPHGNPTVWHLDTPHWSFDSRAALSFWLALDDASAKNGCLAFLPGTHKTAKLDKNIRGSVNVGEIFKLYPEWADITPEVVEVNAGDIIWFNGLLAHAAGANLTAQPRRAMTCIFMPDGATFNGKRNAGIPNEYYKTLKTGDLLDNDAINPLLWRKPK